MLYPFVVILLRTTALRTITSLKQFTSKSKGVSKQNILCQQFVKTASCAMQVLMCISPMPALIAGFFTQEAIPTLAPIQIPKCPYFRFGKCMNVQQIQRETIQFLPRRQIWSGGRQTLDLAEYMVQTALYFHLWP